MPFEMSDLAELDAPEKEYLWTLNFGPQHPATHTTLRLILTLDGETVVKAVPDIGFLHSGFEKLGEHLNFNQYVTIVDRMNYISPLANEIAWHHAVEKLLGIELTPRCKYLRTILADWYQGKACAFCGREFHAIHWHDHQPGLAVSIHFIC